VLFQNHLCGSVHAKHHVTEQHVIQHAPRAVPENCHVPPTPGTMYHVMQSLVKSHVTRQVRDPKINPEFQHHVSDFLHSVLDYYCPFHLHAGDLCLYPELRDACAFYRNRYLREREFHCRWKISMLFSVFWIDFLTVL